MSFKTPKSADVNLRTLNLFISLFRNELESQYLGCEFSCGQCLLWKIKNTCNFKTFLWNENIHLNNSYWTMPHLSHLLFDEQQLISFRTFKIFKNWKFELKFSHEIEISGKAAAWNIIISAKYHACQTPSVIDKYFRNSCLKRRPFFPYIVKTI